jgi:hypothetical protein
MNLARIGLLAAVTSLGFGSAAFAQAWPNQGGSSNTGQFPSQPQQQQQQQPAQPAASGGAWPSSSAAPAAGGGGAWPSAAPAQGGFGAPPMQSGFGAPPGGGGGFGPPGGGAGPSQQSVQRCAEGFLPLRKDAETRAAAIKAASERKAQRDELCEVFKAYATAEAKVVKFVQENQQTCGIPAEAAKAMKSNHGKTLNVRNQVCNAARAGGPTPRAPSLSDALGTSRLPDASTATTSKGTTFDTLTGNPLAR